MDHMLTTIDNPFNPFTQFDEWYQFDTQSGYNTLSFLARVCPDTSNLTDTDANELIEESIDEIIKLNPLGIYRKVAETE